jgi:hypothetical protein
MTHYADDIDPSSDKELIELLRSRLEEIIQILEDYQEDSRPEPHRHKSPPDQISKMVSYQTEVLNKCMGRTWTADHPKHKLLTAIARDVPEELIMNALGAMQDQRQRNLSTYGRVVSNLDSYYIGALKRMCNRDNLLVNIGW